MDSLGIDRSNHLNLLFRSHRLSETTSLITRRNHARLQHLSCIFRPVLAISLAAIPLFYRLFELTLPHRYTRRLQISPENGANLRVIINHLVLPTGAITIIVSINTTRISDHNEPESRSYFHLFTAA